MKRFPEQPFGVRLVPQAQVYGAHQMDVVAVMPLLHRVDPCREIIPMQAVGLAQLIQRLLPPSQPGQHVGVHVLGVRYARNRCGVLRAMLSRLVVMPQALV